MTALIHHQVEKHHLSETIAIACQNTRVVVISVLRVVVGALLCQGIHFRSFNVLLGSSNGC